jgi:hypothetical protein
MATSGAAYGISLAIYFGIAVAVFALFSYWRRVRKLGTNKFYGKLRSCTIHRRDPPLRARSCAAA